MLYFDQIFQAVVQPWVAPVLAVALLLWALVTFFQFRHELSAPYESVLNAAKLIGKTDGAAGFARDFETLNEKLSADPVLGEAWREFDDTLLKPEDGRMQVLSTSRAMDFFNEEALLGPRLHMGYFQAVPNYLVGAGLLFTFVGLVAALYFAGKGVSGDVGTAQKALQELLSAATFKFTTSLAGLAGSIVLSISKKSHLHGFRVAVEDLCEALDLRLTLVTPQSLAARSQRELERQTIELQKFNTDLALSIADALDHKISTSFGAALSPVVTAIADMSQRIGQVNQDALRTMIDDFRSAVQGGASEHAAALGQTFGDVQRTLESLSNGIAQVGGTLREQIDRAAGTMQEKALEGAEAMRRSAVEGAEEMRRGAAAAAVAVGSELQATGEAINQGLQSGGDELLKKMTLAGEAFQSVLGKTGDQMSAAMRDSVAEVAIALRPLTEELNRLEASLADLPAQLDRQRDAAREITRDMAAAGTVLRGVGTELGAVSAPLAAVASNLNAAVDHAKEMISQFPGLLGQLENLNASVNRAAGTIEAAWTSHRTHFEGLDDSMKQVFVQMGDGLESYRAAIEKMVGEIDRGMASAVSSLKIAIESLQETLDDWQETALRDPAKV